MTLPQIPLPFPALNDRDMTRQVEAGREVVRPTPEDSPLVSSTLDVNLQIDGTVTDYHREQIEVRIRFDPVGGDETQEHRLEQITLAELLALHHALTTTITEAVRMGLIQLPLTTTEDTTR